MSAGGTSPDHTPSELIEEFARVLYSRPTNQTVVTLAELYFSLNKLASIEIDELVGQFLQAGMLSFYPNNQAVRLNNLGKSTFETGSSAERVLGPKYIHSTYADAIVHVVVRKPNGDEAGGTAFFIDRERMLVTAKHVVEGNIILRLEDIHQNILSRQITILWMGDEPLDLALLQCDVPTPARPFRFMKNTTYEPLEEILIFGYPPYAGHNVALHVSKGEIHSTPRQLTGSRESIIMSNAVAGGCSGGPVVNYLGIPIGVVSQENQLHSSGSLTGFPSAVPIKYLLESNLL